MVNECTVEDVELCIKTVIITTAVLAIYWTVIGLLWCYWKKLKKVYPGQYDYFASWLFMEIELFVRNLPSIAIYIGMAREDSGHLKETISDEELIQGLLKKDMKANKCKMDDSYDWSKVSNAPDAGKSWIEVVDESMETEASEGNTETTGFAKEDTLDNVKEM